MKNKEVVIKGNNIRFKIINGQDYISLTDMAKTKNIKDPRFVVYSWLKNKETLHFIKVWEELNNSLFNRVEFDTVTKDSGLNSFVISPNILIEKCSVISLTVSAGRYNSGMFAHRDIAFEFASWISAEFKLYLITEFQRLKKNEQQDIGWDAKRELSKQNYHIHISAIKENLIVPNLTKEQINSIYANEADLLNVALFGKTAVQWKKENPDLKGNIRDYASIDQLLVLANMESYNAILIEQNLSQKKD